MGTWTATKPTALTPRPFTLGKHREEEKETTSGLARILQGDILSVLGMCMDPRATTECYRKSRPVFLVTFKDNTNLVIKAEANAMGGDGEHSLLWEGKMMHQASPTFKMKMLGNDELQTLRDLPEIYFSFRPMGTRIRQSSPGLVRQYITDLMGTGRYMFYKMPYYALLDMTEALKGPRTATKLYAILCRAGALRSMGRVIAGDLFNGNADRFDPVTGEIANPNNIFFHKLENGNFEALGVDFFDAISENTNMRGPIQPNWGGYQLRTEQSRTTFANNVVRSLNRLFDQVEGSTGFGEGHAWQIRIGMEEGCDGMKAYINRRIMGKPISQGVLTRARLLGWGL